MMIKCPRCQAEVPWEANPYRPFCSGRCQLIDLSRWSTGEYAIAGEPVFAQPSMDSGSVPPSSAGEDVDVRTLDPDSK